MPLAMLPSMELSSTSRTAAGNTTSGTNSKNSPPRSSFTLRTTLRPRRCQNRSSRPMASRALPAHMST